MMHKNPLLFAESSKNELKLSSYFFFTCIKNKSYLKVFSMSISEKLAGLGTKYEIMKINSERHILNVLHVQATRTL